MGLNLENNREHRSYKNRKMIDGLVKKQRVCCPSVVALMKRVDRALFAPGVHHKFVYADCAVSIGYGTRLSAPSHHARALEVLVSFLPRGGRALDIGCGTGYMTACLAIMAGRDGLVIGVDHVKPLVEDAKTNISKIACPAEMLESRNLDIIRADGRFGWPPEAPYNVIYVGASHENVPSSLLDQLQVGGRLVMPIGKQGEKQTLYHFDKLDNGTIITHAVTDGFFEPLCNLCSQCPVLAHTGPRDELYSP